MRAAYAASIAVWIGAVACATYVVRVPGDIRGYEIVVQGTDTMSRAFARALSDAGLKVRPAPRGGTRPAAALVHFVFREQQDGPAFLYAARIARTPYMLIEGPDSRNLTLVPQSGDRMLVRAVVDDRRNGNANIASATFSVDKAYWEAGYTPRPMQPADGSPNSPLEAFRGVINLAPLAPGRHIVYVRGTDAGGKAGPVSAIFLDQP